MSLQFFVGQGGTANSLIIRDFFGKKMLILKGLFFEDKFYNNVIISMVKKVINGNEKFLSFACMRVGWDGVVFPP